MLIRKYTPLLLDNHTVTFNVGKVSHDWKADVNDIKFKISIVYFSCNLLNIILLNNYPVIISLIYDFC